MPQLSKRAAASPQADRSQLSPDQKYNFVSNLIDSSGWSVAMAFFSTSTIAPAFMSKLGANNLLIGLLPALVTLGYTVPGIFSANFVATRPLVRRWLFATALAERVPLLMMGFAALFIESPTVLLWVFIALYVVHSVLLGINQPAYWVMVAKSVPALWRGRLFGFAGLISGILGFGVLAITNRFLVGNGEQLIHGFGWCYIIGSVIEFASVLPLGFIREPVSEVAADIALPNSARLNMIWNVSPAFRQFIWGQAFFAIWTIAGPFYLLDGIKRLHVNDLQTGLYASIAVIVSAFGGTLFGMVSDRKGNRVILLASDVAAVAASTYAIFAPSPALLSIVFGLTALAGAGTGLAGYNVTMEFAPTEQDVPHYTAFYNVVLSPIRALALICGGLIAFTSSYEPVFMISAVAAAISIVFTMKIVEPRHENIGGRIEEPRV